VAGKLAKGNWMKSLLGLAVALPLGLVLACGDTEEPGPKNGGGSGSGAAGEGAGGQDTARAGSGTAGNGAGGGSEPDTGGAAGAGGEATTVGGMGAQSGSGGASGAAGAGGAEGGQPEQGGAGGADTGDLPLAVAQAAVGELVISEVMRNPVAVDDAFGEWFEIYNATAHAFDLAGLTLADGSASVTVTGSVIIAARSYAVFARSGGAGNGGVTASFVYGDSIQLSNSSDVVRISVAGTVLDEMSYTVAYPNLVGASMALSLATPDAVANDSIANWCTSAKRFGKGDLGSPGAANVGCLKTSAALQAGDLVITEIMANPAAVSDQLGEWFEIYNTSSDAFDLEGLKISDADIDAVELVSSLIIPSGDRLVFGPNATRAANGDVPVNQAYAYASLALANAVDELILSTDIVIDAVTFNGSSVAAGSSLSLSPSSTSATANDAASNWCAASSVLGSTDRGTPGTANDACP
jgi:hypothetical protein